MLNHKHYTQLLEILHSFSWDQIKIASSYRSSDLHNVLAAVRNYRQCRQAQNKPVPGRFAHKRMEKQAQLFERDWYSGYRSGYAVNTAAFKIESCSYRTHKRCYLPQAWKYERLANSAGRFNAKLLLSKTLHAEHTWGQVYKTEIWDEKSGEKKTGWAIKVKLVDHLIDVRSEKAAKPAAARAMTEAFEKRVG